MSWEMFQAWFLDLEWRRLVPELIGKGLGFLAGFAASWFFLFRRRLRDLQRFQQGDSDDVLFQAHYLLPIADARVPSEWKSGERKSSEPVSNGKSSGVEQASDLNGSEVASSSAVQLVFRNVVDKLTVNLLYDNPAARELVKELTEKTSLNDPVLPTEGTLGFELLNDAAGFVAGRLAASPFPRKLWLFCMTCEDRTVVRRRCVRCFLIQVADLERFADWGWVRDCVRVERPWHWFRLVALHRIARRWQAEEDQFNQLETNHAMPLVDTHAVHRHVIPLSLGLPDNEVAVADPFQIDWVQHRSAMKNWNILLEDSKTAGSRPAMSEIELS